MRPKKKEKKTRRGPRGRKRVGRTKRMDISLDVWCCAHRGPGGESPPPPPRLAHLIVGRHSRRGGHKHTIHTLSPPPGLRVRLCPHAASCSDGNSIFCVQRYRHRPEGRRKRVVVCVCVRGEGGGRFANAYLWMGGGGCGGGEGKAEKRWGGRRVATHRNATTRLRTS